MDNRLSRHPGRIAARSGAMLIRDLMRLMRALAARDPGSAQQRCTLQRIRDDGYFPVAHCPITQHLILGSRLAPE